MSITSFDNLPSILQAQGVRKRVAAVCPTDDSSRAALQRAEEEGLITPLIFTSDDPAEAARNAVEAVRLGKADILMKGFVSTDTLLRAILDKENGILPHGNLLTHITVASMPAYHKLLFFTDAAVIPYPTHEQRKAQIATIAAFCRRFGIACPKISMIHCFEKINPKHFPFTSGFPELKLMAEKGVFGSCVLDGPLDLKTSCSPISMNAKKIDSPIGGDADALIFPDIESGNIFYKTITLFCGATTAGVLQGSSAPVVLASRGDNADVKYTALCVASLL